MSMNSIIGNKIGNFGKYYAFFALFFAFQLVVSADVFAQRKPAPPPKNARPATAEKEKVNPKSENMSTKTGTGFDVFAPFVSNVHAEIRATDVIFTWSDSKSVKGPVYIYRSKIPFRGGMDFDQRQSTVVAYGVQKYSETIVDSGQWYFFFVASDESNQKYDLIIPLNNIISFTIDGQNYSIDASRSRVNITQNTNYLEAPMQSFPYQQAIESAEFNAKWPAYAGSRQMYSGTLHANVGRISAVAQDNFIIITYSYTEREKTPVLYRSIQPIRRHGDLITATALKVGATSPFVDYVTPGVPYYYAIVYEEDLMEGRANIVPGDNSTFIPTEVVIARNQNQNMPANPYGYGYTGKPSQPYQPVAAPSMRIDQKNAQPNAQAGAKPVKGGVANPYTPVTPAYSNNNYAQNNNPFAAAGNYPQNGNVNSTPYNYSQNGNKNQLAQNGNGYQQNGNGYQQNGYQQNGNGYQQAGNNYQQNGNVNSTPYNYSQNGNTNQTAQNGNGYQQNGYQQNGNNYQQNGYQQNGNNYQQNGYQQTGNNYQQNGNVNNTPYNYSQNGNTNQTAQNGNGYQQNGYQQNGNNYQQNGYQQNGYQQAPQTNNITGNGNVFSTVIPQTTSNPAYSGTKQDVVISEPRVINQDLNSLINDQDDYELSQIVRGPFMWRDWNASRESFLRYMAKPRSSSAIARSRFYLAQSFYFLGDYTSGLQEFIAVQSRWPDEVAIWVQACLSKINN
ncbi:MAG: hypothetical protein Ta2F_04090 [Termitinemataceae bacterium]|nr:MAG: hypothetical protein Ta2F_04090 [Termitinemataceae bacterium]